MQKRTTDTGFQIDALSSLSDRRILLDADLSGRERHPPSLILEPPLKNSRRRKNMRKIFFAEKRDYF